MVDHPNYGSDPLSCHAAHSQPPPPLTSQIVSSTAYCSSRKNMVEPTKLTNCKNEAKSSLLGGK